MCGRDDHAEGGQEGEAGDGGEAEPEAERFGLVAGDVGGCVVMWHTSAYHARGSGSKHSLCMRLHRCGAFGILTLDLELWCHLTDHADLVRERR